MRGHYFAIIITISIVTIFTLPIWPLPLLSSTHPRPRPLAWPQGRVGHGDCCATTSHHPHHHHYHHDHQNHCYKEEKNQTTHANAILWSKNSQTFDLCTKFSGISQKCLSCLENGFSAQSRKWLIWALGCTLYDILQCHMHYVWLLQVFTMALTRAACTFCAGGLLLKI